MILSATTLDDFLARRDSGGAERLRSAGELLGTTGVLVSFGLVAFLTLVHRGPRREIERLVSFVVAMGAFTLLGGLAELVGVGRRFEVGLSEATTLEAGTAPMMRVLAGLLILLGVFNHTRPLRVDQPTDDGATSDPGSGSPPDVADDRIERWAMTAGSSFGLAGLLLGVFSFAFDGHTVTQGSRVPMAFADALHVSAAGVWVGGIVGLVTIAGFRHREPIEDHPVGDLLIRFSSVATLALIAVVAAGVAMTAMIIDSPGDLTDTTWGRRLIVKVIGVALAAMIGGYHHVRVVPGLVDEVGGVTLDRRARTTLAIELMAMLFVVVATVSLVNGTINP